MTTPYTPIDCTIHDELLSLATLRHECVIVYRSEDGKEVSVSDTIGDAFTGGKKEFLRLRWGTVVRLDRIVSVNGKPLRTNCPPS